MSRQVKNLTRREFLQKTGAAGAVISLSPLERLAYSQSPTKNRIVVAHGVGVYSLNPYAVNTSPLQAVWGSVMEPLIDADYDKRGYQGVLAESWQMKGARLQFKLRNGVRFHDGTPFSSKDVVASFKRILTDKQSLQAPNLGNIKEMDAPDDLTVVLTLKKAGCQRIGGYKWPVNHETFGGGKNGRG